MTTPNAPLDRPLFGILLMLGFCMVVPLSDAMAKLLGGTVSLLALVVIRFVFPLLIITPLIWHRREVLRLPPALFGWMGLRAGLHLLGMILMFTALRFLPLADAVAIAFVAPFLMLLMGWFFLNEQVGPHRIAAATVGFLGVLLVIQPNFAKVGTAALLPLGVAVAFSAYALVTRRVAKDVDPMGAQVINGAIGCAVLVPLWLVFEGPSTLAFPPHIIWFVVVFGVTGTVTKLLMTWSLRFAPSATLAPMQYLEIPFATLMGWLFFRELPNGLAGVGIAITVTAGLYVIAREHRQARKDQARKNQAQQVT